jgi:hypothetical protein
MTSDFMSELSIAINSVSLDDLYEMFQLAEKSMQKGSQAINNLWLVGF